jgi:ribonuclease VapC
VTATLAVDSSAIVAILTGEPEQAAFRSLLDGAPAAFCSTASFVETFMVLSARITGLTASELDAALQTIRVELLPLDAEQAVLAAEAFARFGKGRHPAKLNLGDCFSYALAKSLNAPLLYKGEDFGRTDLVAAGPSQELRP